VDGVRADESGAADDDEFLAAKIHPFSSSSDAQAIAAVDAGVVAAVGRKPAFVDFEREKEFSAFCRKIPMRNRLEALGRDERFVHRDRGTDEVGGEACLTAKTDELIGPIDARDRTVFAI